MLCSRWNQTKRAFHTVDCAAYMAPRLPAPEVTRSSAEVARDRVLDDAGASRRVGVDGWRANRDLTDARVATDVRKGTGRIIGSRAEVPGWPSLAGGSPPLDDDRDGMPTSWEASHCLDRAPTTTRSTTTAPSTRISRNI
jgi:hypothetical protein